MYYVSVNKHFDNKFGKRLNKRSICYADCRLVESGPGATVG